jgi:hypothetical protein
VSLFVRAMQSMLESSRPFEGLLTRQEQATKKREERIRQLREEEEKRAKEEAARFRAKPIAATSLTPFNLKEEREREEAVRKVCELANMFTCESVNL